MRPLSQKFYLIPLLFHFQVRTQVADIYDILTREEIQQKREGDQYVVGIYKEVPKHAVSKESKVISMKNKYGSEFTCLVPRLEADIEEQSAEAESKSDGVEKAAVEEVEIYEEPDEDLVEQESGEELAVLDKLTWFLQNYEGSCLKYDAGFWKTKVCFQPVPHITQWHDKTTFDLGKLSGVFDPENPEHRRLKSVARPRKKTKKPFLQLAFTGGTDGRISLVNIGCAHIYDRVKKLSEPIQLVYVFDLSTKLACNYETDFWRDLRTKKQKKKQNVAQSPVLNELTGSVEEILDETFSKLKKKGSNKKSCLYYTPGWFTFEICYQKHILQYHMERSRAKYGPMKLKEKVTQQFSLGDWDGAPLNIITGSTPENTYAEAVFVEGTECDLTAKPRRSTVRFKCNKDIKSTRIELFQEVETCVYLFVIGISSLCNLEGFKTEPLNTKEIICYLANSPPDIAKVENSDASDDFLDEDSML